MPLSMQSKIVVWGATLSGVVEETKVTIPTKDLPTPPPLPNGLRVAADIVAILYDGGVALSGNYSVSGDTVSQAGEALAYLVEHVFPMIRASALACQTQHKLTEFGGDVDIEIFPRKKEISNGRPRPTNDSTTRRLPIARAWVERNGEDR